MPEYPSILENQARQVIYRFQDAIGVMHQKNMRSHKSTYHLLSLFTQKQYLKIENNMDFSLLQD